MKIRREKKMKKLNKKEQAHDTPFLDPTPFFSFVHNIAYIYYIILASCIERSNTEHTIERDNDLRHHAMYSSDPMYVV